MNKHKHIALLNTLLLALTMLALNTPQADAHATRELITSFGNMERPAGIAVDLETGNVYVTDNKPWAVHVFGPEGGPPLDGVPSEITGVHLISGEGFDELPSGIAIDNSCYEHEPRLTGAACEEFDPSYGDVYVVNEVLGVERGIQKFTLNTNKQYEKVEVLPVGHEPDALTIDSHGDLYVAHQLYPEIIKFQKHVEGSAGEVKESLKDIVIGQKAVEDVGYIAIDEATSTLYASTWAETGLEFEHGPAKIKLGPSDEILAEEMFGGIITGIGRPLAVVPGTGTLFLGDGDEIAEYDAGGKLQLTFGSQEVLGGSLGIKANGIRAIAVNPETNRIYAVNPLHDDVDVFGGVISPPLIGESQPPVRAVTQTSALLAGTANPESGQATYYFEYVAADEYSPAATDPYAQGGRTAITALAGATTPETVERVALTGLLPGTTYHYRMVVGNATATAHGPDETLTTAAATPPEVSTSAASGITATSAILSGVVSPHGLPTSYVFEIGPSAAYGGARLFGSAGSGTGTVPVTVSLQYLAPGTTYHYRLVATSFDGTNYGQDATFTTAGVPSPVGQPASTPLIASPALPFPSIAGAITEPRAKPSNGTGSQKKLKRVLRACHALKTRVRRSRCEAHARKQYGGAAHSRTANTTHSRRK